MADHLAPKNGTSGSHRSSPPIISPVASVGDGEDDRNARNAAALAGSGACQAWRLFEESLCTLEEQTPRGGELALVLAIARDRLELHHLTRHRHVLQEHGLDVERREAA